jgi:hypothetical protein
MNQLPFSVYDFFGYLASGVLILAGVTVAFVGDEPLGETPSFLVGLLLIIAAYVVGHIDANIAGDLIERRLVRDRLHRPTEILLGEHAPPSRLARLLPGYYSPLPASLCVEIKTLADGRDAEALFLHCHATMKSDSVVQERLATFLNLYGFCRNATLALCTASICLAIGMVLGTAETGQYVAPGWWMMAALVGAVGMLYRYLKFYRQYAFELLTSYAERKAI